MRVFRNFHFERKSDSRSDDKNVKMIINENDNDSIQFFSQRVYQKTDQLVEQLSLVDTGMWQTQWW